MVSSIEVSVEDLKIKRRYELKEGGIIVFEMFRIVEKPSFVEILRSGLQLSLAIAIDYTASNGELSDPRSLHAMNN